jgi:hypothetical protein
LGVCVLFMKDAGNCGSCGVACPLGKKCDNGMCKGSGPGPGNGD